MQRREVEILNKLGLHARASAKLTQLASRFPCDIFMEKSGRRVNAKSIMGVMMLAAGHGAKITVEANGDKENEALDAIEELVNDYFGEGD
jgi:phosphocarrier protein